MTSKGLKILDSVSFSILAALIPLLGIASVIEKSEGSQFVSRYIYDSPYFFTLWCLLGASATIYLFARRITRRPAVAFLHFSLLIILVGAGITHIFGTQGVAQFSKDRSSVSFTTDGGESAPLPERIQLVSFNTDFYPGTDAPMGFSATLAAGSDTIPLMLNHAAQVKGFSFCLKSYDPGKENLTVSVQHDPAGTAVSYAGYALLFISMVFIFISRRSGFRALRRRMVAPILIFLPLLCQAAPLVDQEDAEAFADLSVMHADRIASCETMSRSIAKKITGSFKPEGLDPVQFLLDLSLNSDYWGNRPVIKVKSARIRKELGITSPHAAYNDFITPDNRNKLTPLLADAEIGREAREANEKFQLMRMAMEGRLFRIFPISGPEGVRWYSPAERLPLSAESDEYAFVRHSFNLLSEMIITGRHNEFAEVCRKIRIYQEKRAGDSYPSASRRNSEKILNRISCPFAPVLLLIGFAGWIFYLCTTLKERPVKPLIRRALTIAVWLTAAYLLLIFILKWIAGAHVPLGNGPDTMLFLALCVCIAFIFMGRRLALPAPYALLIAGLASMVAMMGDANPQVSVLMPVLNSPLLSIHVALVMCGYAMLAFILLNSLSALIFGHRPGARRLTLSSRLLLYPGVFLLAAGIFTGAIWANVSWGRYWGWDPKEVWALITLMVYALPFHTVSIPAFRRDRFFNIYCAVAFLSVVITYFGVNFLLGGMHSYA